MSKLFFNHEASDPFAPRFYGAENEYTITYPDNLDAGKEDPQFWDFIPPSEVLALDGDSYLGITPDGGKLYPEHGQIAEICTPECSSGYQLALHERVSELRAARIADHITKTYDTRSIALKRAGWANIRDPSNPHMLLFEAMSTGHHENYSVTDTNLLSSIRAVRALTTYLVTRKAWTGAGIVTQKGFEIAQRSDATDYLAQEKTSLTEHRHKRPWRQHTERFELRDGDANRSEWVKRYKYPLTSAAFRLIELGKYPYDLLVDNPQQAIRMIAQNPDTPLLLENGATITAMDLQAELFSMADDKFGALLPDEEREAIGEFAHLHMDFQQVDTETGDVSAISDRIDWAAKLDHMQRKGLSKSTIHGGNFKALHYDIGWEDVAPGGFADRWYMKHGRVQLKPTELARAHAQPPATRARRRVDTIINARKGDTDADFSFNDWTMIRVNGREIPLGGPGAL